jgi:thiamine pyrophosphokinase
MVQPRFFSEKPVICVGGGAMSEADLALMRALDLPIFAADGGAHRLANADDLPLQAIIGDLDSIDDHTHWPPSLFCQIDEQQTTDFEKCLYSIAAPLVIGFGFLGGRLDHTLASLHALRRYRDRPVVLIGGEDAVFLAPTKLTLKLEVGARISIIPQRRCKALASTGLAWPINGLILEMGTMIGTSNRATDALVGLEFDQKEALVVVDRRFAPAVIEAISG